MKVTDPLKQREPSTVRWNVLWAGMYGFLTLWLALVGYSLSIHEAITKPLFIADVFMSLFLGVPVLGRIFYLWIWKTPKKERS
jgi:hypothetical protein